MVDESKLIIIASQPRAGSTLTQKLLSNNDYVDTVSEPWLLLPFLNLYRPELIKARYHYPVALAAVFDYFDKKGLNETFRLEYRKFILSLYKPTSGSQYFIDKTPRYYEILPVIVDFFPEAKIIIVKRNLFASLYSMISMWSGKSVKYSFFKEYHRDFLLAPFLLQKFCDEQQGNSHAWVVCYETMVSNPGGEVKKIYDWLEIPFTEAVLDVGRNEKTRGMYGDDSYKRDPLKEVSGSSAVSWEKALKEDRELSLFFGDYQEYLGEEFIRHYGYEPADFNRPKFRFGKSLFKDFLLRAGMKDKRL